MTKELAPREGFEPPTFRLTASVVISSEVAGAKLNGRELANCSKIQRVASSAFVYVLFAFCRCSPQLILRYYYVCPFQIVRILSETIASPLTEVPLVRTLATIDISDCDPNQHYLRNDGSNNRCSPRSRLHKPYPSVV